MCTQWFIQTFWSVANVLLYDSHIIHISNIYYGINKIWDKASKIARYAIHILLKYHMVHWSEHQFTVPWILRHLKWNESWHKIQNIETSKCFSSMYHPTVNIIIHWALKIPQVMFTLNMYNLLTVLSVACETATTTNTKQEEKIIFIILFFICSLGHFCVVLR